MEPAELRSALAMFTGSDDFYRHANTDFSYTDGVRFLAEQAGAYWLLDSISSWQKRARKDRMLRDFQIWELRVDLVKKTGFLVCLRDSDDEAFRERIPFTDFPLDSIRLYLENNVLMLPGER
jgi:hypothetical protein